MAEPSPDATFHLNFRIISCRKLLKGDRDSSDPYVKIMLGKKELHRTKHLLKTLNPVFATKDDNAFSTEIKYGDLTKAGGLGIEVKDWDRIGTNDLIGLANIEPARLLALARMGKTTSIKLEVPKRRKEKDAGFLTLCIQDPEGGMDSDEDSSSDGSAKLSVASENSSHASEKVPVNAATPLPNLAIDPSDSGSDSDSEGPPTNNDDNNNKEEQIKQEVTKPEPPDDATCDLNFRIVSCRKLLKGDRDSSDPYVKIMVGKKELHRTKHVLKNLNPVFGPKHDNTFSAKINYGALKFVGGLGIEVKDWDRVGTNDLIGLGNIEPARLLELASIGRPATIKLDVPKGRKETEAGFVTICVQDTGFGDTSDDDWSNDGDQMFAPLPKMSFSIPAADGPPSYDKELLIEIMSCQNLIAADTYGKSDPYVVISMDGKVLHKTRRVENTLNPAYSVDHKNKYFLKCSSKVLWANGGIQLDVKDHDIMGHDDELGYVNIPPETLYESNGEFMEFNLRPPNNKLGKGKTDAGTIAVRIRESKLEDKDKRAAFERAAVSDLGRGSTVVDDRAEWEAEANYTGTKPKREKVYMEDSDSSSDSSDMYMDSSQELDSSNLPKEKPAKTTNQVDEDGDKPMPQATDSGEQMTSKWGNQKVIRGGDRGTGRGGRGGRGVTVMEGRGGRGALYVPSIKPGDMFDQEIEALENQQEDGYGDEVSLDEEKDDVFEKLVEKNAKINELEMEVETLKEQNSKLRSELSKMRYKLKANLPKRENSKKMKIPLAQKRSVNSDEEEDIPKAEEKPVPPSALEKAKFGGLDFGLDALEEPSDEEKAEKPKEEKQGKTLKANVGVLDFGLDAPTFSSDDSEDEGSKPSRGNIAPIDSVVSDVPPLGLPPNLHAPLRGIPGIRLSELDEWEKRDSGDVLAPTRGIPAVRLSELSEVSENAGKRGVSGSSGPARSKERLSELPSSDDDTSDSEDEEDEPQRGVLKKMGMTDSMIGRASLYSFIQQRSSEDPENLPADTNEPPDFDRKHKDMQFAKMDFVGIASERDLRKGGINAMPSLAVNPSAILAADEDSDEEEKKNMVGISVDKDYDKSSRRNFDDNLEETTTTVVSQTAMYQRTLSGRRVVQLEQEIQELKEELELSKANPGGYEKVSLEVQLKVAQDTNKKLEAENARLQKMNKIQMEAVYDLSKKHKGSFW